MRFLKGFLLISFIIFLSFSASRTLAQGSAAGTQSSSSAAGSIEPIHLDNPLGNVDTPQELIGTVINAALGVIGSIALIMFIYGGFVWLTSSGNEQKVTQGRNILMWAAIGLVIIFLSYALVKFVITDLIGAV